jgi:hypothetical protein
MIKLYTTLLLLLCSCMAFAQSQFRSGYIVTLTGDTLSGFVDYKESRASNKFCSFKQNEGGNPQQFGIDDIRAYGFRNDKAYEAKSIQKKDEERVKAFVEVLVKGRLNLYFYESRFFVEKNLDQLLELKNQEEETYINNTRVVKRSNEHIATLNTLMIECQSLLDKIEEVSLSQRSLVTLVKNYNDCVAPGENVTLKEEKKWLVAKAGIAGAANTENLSFSSSDRRLALFDHARFDRVYYPSAGVVLNVVSPRIIEKLSLQVEAFYSVYDFAGYSNYASFSEDAFHRNDFTLELTSLKLNTAFRYTFLGKAATPYFNIGLSNRLLLNNKAFRVQETESGNTIETSEYTDTFLNEHHAGMFVGAGASFKLFHYKLFSELRYDKGMHIATPPDFSNVSRTLKSGSDTFSLLVGFYIN